MASTSKSYDPSPERERFQRLKRAPTGSERAASPSESSSAGSIIGGKLKPSPQFHILSGSFYHRRGLANSSRVVTSQSHLCGKPALGSLRSDHQLLGVRLDLLSIADSQEDKYTPPHARQGQGLRFSRAFRRDAGESPTCVVTTDDRDDVFISPTKTIKERRSEHSITTANIQRLDVALANADAQEHPLRERSSTLNARHQINGVDAQNLYPPTACVFVAK